MSKTETQIKARSYYLKLKESGYFDRPEWKRKQSEKARKRREEAALALGKRIPSQRPRKNFGQKPAMNSIRFLHDMVHTSEQNVLYYDNAIDVIKMEIESLNVLMMKVIGLKEISTKQIAEVENYITAMNTVRSVSAYDAITQAADKDSVIGKWLAEKNKKENQHDR